MVFLTVFQPFSSLFFLTPSEDIFLSWTKSLVKEDLQNGVSKDVAREAVSSGKNRLCWWLRAMVAYDSVD